MGNKIVLDGKVDNPRKFLEEMLEEALVLLEKDEEKTSRKQLKEE